MAPVASELSTVNDPCASGVSDTCLVTCWHHGRFTRYYPHSWVSGWGFPTQSLPCSAFHTVLKWSACYSLLLIKTGMCRHILVQTPIARFHENPLNHCQTVTCPCNKSYKPVSEIFSCEQAQKGPYNLQCHSALDADFGTRPLHRVDLLNMHFTHHRHSKTPTALLLHSQILQATE